jgi:hypothetical protein
MSASLRRSLPAVILLLLGGHSPAADEPLPRTEVARIGKAATALVENKPRYGSAFCIHPAGLFITNAHVIPEAGNGPITLILDAGLKTQKVLKAHVVRRDEGRDLALLRVEGKRELSALELGADDNLTELEELVALGFPFGPALAVERGNYPTISVNVGSITALRRDHDGKLSRIQLDAVLNPGNSGGPVLDRRGKVVGVVVSGVWGTQVNMAVPVSHVRRFLEKPDVQFTPPRLDAAGLHKPVTFEARALPLLPGGKPPELELLLGAEGVEERRLGMAKEGDVYRVTAPAVPAADGPAAVRVQATYPGGSVAGSVDDTTLQVGTEKVPLSQVRSIRFAPRPTVTLADGKALTGEVPGLDRVRVRLGKVSLTLDLTQALEARFEPPAATDAVSYTLVVRQGGREVERLTGLLPVAGAEARTSPSAVDVGIRKKTVRLLPSPAADAAVGGGGRYLILFLPRERQLAIFDAGQARVVKYLSVPDDHLKFTAGRDKLIVALPGQGVLLRYNLNTFEREQLVSSLPFRGRIDNVCMGCASGGPLLVEASEEGNGPFRRKSIHFLDIATFKEIEARLDPQHFGAGMGLDFQGEYRASPDGKFFTMWRTNVSPQGIQTLIVGQHEITGKYEHSDAGYLAPGADGRTLFTAYGLYSLQQLRPLQDDASRRQSVLPAASGNYYVRFAPGESNTTVEVLMAGDEQPLVELHDIDGLAKGKPQGPGYYVPDPLGLGNQGRTPFGTDKRFFFLPESKLIVVIPAAADRLLLHPFDVEEALEKSGRNYLVVTSQPPLAATKGTTYTYALKVRSKRGGLKYKLEAAPTGMTLSPGGTVSWEVPTGFVEAQTNVLISITDASGQERFHSFTLDVRP